MTMRRLQHLLATVMAGLAAALLVSCGGSGKGLIPEADAGPLRNDFEAVAQAAETGNGNCANTERALSQTEHDFVALPAGTNAALRRRLQQGISNLRSRALSACAEPIATATNTTNTSTTGASTTQTAPTTPATTPQAPTHTGATPSEHGGGTPVEEGTGEPGEGKGRGNGEGKGVGKESNGESESNSGGTSAGGGH